MQRRTFLGLAGLSAASRAFTQEMQPPNIVIALCDDLGAADLGCTGHPFIRTPNLDRFADEGIRFTQFYAAAPVCSPSRAGLLTGRTPNRAGIYDWISAGSPVHLRDSETTLAALLRERGYATCFSGKWHLNGLEEVEGPGAPARHGFEHWFATQNNAAPSHENPVNYYRNGKPAGPLQGYSADLAVAEAVRWMESVPRGRPLFLYLAFHEPHEPVASAPDLVSLYPQARQRGEALYYANVTQIDRAFGRLLEALDQRGARANTLVLFSSDNGPEWLDRYQTAWRSHGSAGLLRSRKLSLYEGGIRVPGLLRWPARVAPGRIVRAPACLLDVLPTVCEITGARRPPKPLDGESLAPLLAAQDWQRRRPLHWHYFNSIDPPRAALREGDWKILGIGEDNGARRAGGGFRPGDLPRVKEVPLNRFELYNLREDPREERDLWRSGPERARRMAQRLVEIDAEVRREAPSW